MTVVAPSGNDLGTLDIQDDSSLHIQPSATSSGFLTLTGMNGAKTKVLSRLTQPANRQMMLHAVQVLQRWRRSSCSVMTFPYLLLTDPSCALEMQEMMPGTCA